MCFLLYMNFLVIVIFVYGVMKSNGDGCDVEVVIMIV